MRRSSQSSHSLSDNNHYSRRLAAENPSVSADDSSQSDKKSAAPIIAKPQTARQSSNVLSPVPENFMACLADAITSKIIQPKGYVNLPHHRMTLDNFMKHCQSVSSEKLRALECVFRQVSEAHASNNFDKPFFERELHEMHKIINTNHNHLLWMEKIASDFTQACVNQQLMGFINICAWLHIAQSKDFIEQINHAWYLCLYHDVYAAVSEQASLNQVPGIYTPEISYYFIKKICKELIEKKSVSDLKKGGRCLGVYQSGYYESNQWGQPYCPPTLSTKTWAASKQGELVYQQLLQRMQQKTVRDVCDLILTSSTLSHAAAMIFCPEQLQKVLDKKNRQITFMQELLTVVEQESSYIQVVIDLEKKYPDYSEEIHDIVLKNMVKPETIENLQLLSSSGYHEEQHDFIRETLDFLQSNKINKSLKDNKDYINFLKHNVWSHDAVRRFYESVKEQEDQSDLACCHMLQRHFYTALSTLPQPKLRP